MAHITYHDGIGIALVVFYTPAFLIALLLSLRHGFSASAGWRLLLTFTLARLLSGAFQLATIHSPDNTSLYIGIFVLLNVAVSPLQLTALGLLNRLIGAINSVEKKTGITTRQISVVMLINLVGLILTIWGGIRAGNHYSSSGKYTPDSLTKAGLALFIFSLVAIVLGTVVLSKDVNRAPSGEKRIWIAVAVSVPFLIVRMVYSAVGVFGQSRNFNSVTGSATILLCVALLEEAVVVLLYEGMGITLKKIVKPPSNGTSQRLGPVGRLRQRFGRRTVQRGNNSIIPLADSGAFQKEDQSRG